VPSPTGGYCSHIQGYLDPEELHSQLLFACAEATLAAGGRYFRLTASSNSHSLFPSTNPQDYSGGFREGHMCFDSVPQPTADSDGYDSAQVVQNAAPALRKRLSPEARRTLKRVTTSQIPPGA
jgi:hypothetical protein